MTITLSLTSKQPVVSNIWLFTFAPSEPISWEAGQFIRVELPYQDSDAAGGTRFFTIASAPADGHVQIATRITSSTFKQTLSKLPIGGQLTVLDLPAGDFVWPADTAKPLVFAAQGIGITPVRSLIRQRLADHQPIPATLIYTNLAPGLPFESELNQWGTHPEFSLRLLDRSITPGLLAELIPNLNQSLVYVTGPKSLIELLSPPYNLSVANLKQDQFPNYAAADY